MNLRQGEQYRTTYYICTSISMPRILWTRVFAALLVAVSLSSVLAQGAVVTTEPEVRLRQGLPGSVSCTVTRKLFAVYWKKGETIETATPVVILDTFYNNGEISGPGFDDGEFTVASNYSLIFTNARSTDSGRYFCEVSDYESGSLYRSYSDVMVFDPPVITDVKRVLQYGDPATLRCQYEEPVYGIYWLKGDTYADAEQLVVLDLFYEIGERKGPGYDQRGYNISGDFSLVINSTKIGDRGRYFCAVSDLATGRLLTNTTYVDVFATPQEPFPEIDTCVPISTYESVQTCEITEDSNTTVSLTCTVKRYYPNISMSFSDTSNMASTVQVSISNDTEGLLTQVVTIVLLVGTDPVTCTASGLPFETTRTTQGVFTPTTTAGNQTDRNDVIALPAQGNGDIAAICVTLILLGLVFGIAGYFFYRRKSQNEKGNMVSFVELWFMLLSREQPTKEITDSFARVTTLIKEEHGPEDAEPLMGLSKTPEEMFNDLCSFNDEPNGPIKLEDLFECLQKCNLEDEIRRLEDFRKDFSKRIPKNAIKRLIWEINDRQKIEIILKSLEISQPYNVPPGSYELENTNIYTRTLKSLDDWQKVNGRENPWVLLNFAVEKADCKPIDRTFFRDEGAVSYVELWKLSHYKSGTDYFSKISEVCSILQDGNVGQKAEILSEDDVYAKLCQWKQSESSCEHQKDLLLAVLKANGLEDTVHHIRRTSDNAGLKICLSTLAILIWDINDVEKVENLLNELGILFRPPSFHCGPGKTTYKVRYFRAVIESLHRWRQKPQSNPPLVLLSLAAERAKCTHTEQEFFKESGLISYLELWELVHFNEGQTFLEQISGMLEDLLENDSLDIHIPEDSSTEMEMKLHSSKKDAEGTSSTEKENVIQTSEKVKAEASTAGQETEEQTGEKLPTGIDIEGNTSTEDTTNASSTGKDVEAQTPEQNTEESRTPGTGMEIQPSGTDTTEGSSSREDTNRTQITDASKASITVSGIEDHTSKNNSAKVLTTGKGMVGQTPEKDTDESPTTEVKTEIETLDKNTNKASSAGEDMNQIPKTDASITSTSGKEIESRTSINDAAKVSTTRKDMESQTKRNDTDKSSTTEVEMEILTPGQNTTEASSAGQEMHGTSIPDTSKASMTVRGMENHTSSNDAAKVPSTGKYVEGQSPPNYTGDSYIPGIGIEDETLGNDTTEIPTTGEEMDGYTSKTDETKPLIKGNCTEDDASATDSGELLTEVSDNFVSAKGTSGAMTAGTLYRSLCKWKQNSSSGVHQKALLMAAMKAHGLSSIVKYINECRTNVRINLEPDMIKGLVESLDGGATVNRFLRELLGHERVEGKQISMEDANKVMELWSQRPFHINPLIAIDLALEKAGCNTLAMNFVTDFRFTVTFVELWNTLRYIEWKGQLPKVEPVVNSLSKRNHSPQDAPLSIKDMYKKLCEWKKSCSSCFQTGVLKAVLREKELMSAAEFLEDFRLNKLDHSKELDVNILKCIIWSLNDEEVKAFLTEFLAAGKKPHTGGKRDTRKAAIVELQRWSKQTFTTNPLVLLSIGMENAGLENLAEDFCTGGPLAFLELWQLVHNDIDTFEGSLSDLNSTADMLLESKESSTVTARGVYEKLCKWKASCSRDYQWRVLTMALEMNGLNSHAEYMKKYRHEQKPLADEELEHILWNLRDFTKDNNKSYLARNVQTLLVKLGLRYESTQIKESDEMDKTVTKATSYLSEWMKTGREVTNCIVLLALSLEDAGFSPIDKEFFIVDRPQKLPVDFIDLSRLLTAVHRDKLSRMIQKASHKTCHSAKEHRATLFDVTLMFQDWNDSQRCSYYEKRCKLNNAALGVERSDIAEHLRGGMVSGDSFTKKKDKSTKSREESGLVNLVSTVALEQLTTYLNTQSARKLCSKLNVNYEEKHTNEMLEILTEWRSRASEKDHPSKLRDTLSNALNEIDLNVLTDVELKNLQDNVPREFHSRIANKLKSGKWDDSTDFLSFLTGWRDSQLKKSKTYKESRTNLHNTLESVGAPTAFVPLPVAKTHVFKVELVDVAFHLLMQDVYPMAEALGIHSNELEKYRCPHDLNSGTLFLVGQLFIALKTRKAFAEALWKEFYLDVARYLSLDYEMSYTDMIAMTAELTDEEMKTELPQHLGMRNTDVTSCRDEMGSFGRLEMFRLWKRTVYSVPYNYQATLDKALRSLGFKRAEEFETAALASPQKEGTSLSTENAEPDEDHVLYKLLLHDIRGSNDEQQKSEGRYLIKTWLSNQKKSRNDELAQRVLENDKILERGFVEVAREMMAIEYHLMTAKSFRPRRGFKRKAKMVLKGETRK